MLPPEKQIKRFVFQHFSDVSQSKFSTKPQTGFDVVPCERQSLPIQSEQCEQKVIDKTEHDIF